MVVWHWQIRQPGVTDWSWLCSRICQICFHFYDWLTCAWRGSYSQGKSFYYLFLGFIACLNHLIPHEWAKSSYECLRKPPNGLQFSSDVQECIRNLVQIKIFESGNSWPKFWTAQDFWVKFAIDLQMAITDYGLWHSVKIFTNGVLFSHKSKYLSIPGNSWDGIRV